jgi:Protein of unknown function (DUF998)
MNITRLASLAGTIGPIWLGGTILALTILQYDFMLSLRWHPTRAPQIDWPSGLALGPYGLFMTFAFLFSGICLFIFALGMRQFLGDGRGSRLSFGLLCGASLGLVLLAFPTDPTFRNTPATWSGLIHDSSFVLLGVCLLAAFLVLASQFRHRPAWRSAALGAIIVALALIPAFLLKGGFFYVFLVVALGWIVWTAQLLRPKRLAKPASPVR